MIRPGPKKLKNIHNNVEFKPTKMWQLTNLPADGSVPKATARRKIGQESIQEVLSMAEAQKVDQVRCLGARWSLSEVANAEGWLLQTEDLQFVQTSLRTLHPKSPFTGSRLAWVQGGTRVAQINASLGAANKSLKTSGASNGQTIVGASCTGTHGAAFGVGSIHDTIRGMHIVCSSTRSVWLEAASAPVLPDSSVRRIFGPGCELIRHDPTFFSAQVAMGCFGVVESLVVETEPLFLLSVFRKKMLWDKALRDAIRAFKFNEGQGELHHLDVTFDPREVAAGGELHPWVTTMYKRKAPAGFRYVDAKLPRNVIVSDPAAVSWATAATFALPVEMLKAASRLLSQRFVPQDPNRDPSQIPVPLGVAFNDVVMNNLGASCEIGVPMTHLKTAIDLVTEEFRKSANERREPFLGPVALRFVQSSKAPLAFTRFGPVTCCIELPGARLSWVPGLYRKVQKSLTDHGVPFTLHWGQEGDFSKEAVLRAYGPGRIAQWKRARRRILNSKELRQRFSNQMIKEAGLHEA